MHSFSDTSFNCPVQWLVGDLCISICQKLLTWATVKHPLPAKCRYLILYIMISDLFVQDDWELNQSSDLDLNNLKVWVNR